MSTNSSSDPIPAAKPPARFKALLVNLGLSLCSLLVFAGLFELALRLMGYGNIEIYEPDPIVYWRLKPNQNCYTKVDHKPVHINSQGTRGAEFQVPKPPRTLRIVSLGDSRTFGWGLSEGETYSGVLEKQLQQFYGTGKRVEVINSGVNAWGFPQMTAYFREYALKFQPDYVIVGDANLWTQFSEQNSPEFIRKFMWRVRLKNLLRRSAIYHYVVEVKMNDVYERYRVKFVPVDPKQDTLFKEQQQNDPGAFFRKAVGDLCSVALSNRVKPILIYLPTQEDAIRQVQKNLRQAKAEVGQQLGIPFVDLSSVLSTNTGKTLYLDADPIHFSGAGNEMIGQRLFQTLTNLAAHE